MLAELPLQIAVVPVIVAVGVVSTRTYAVSDTVQAEELTESVYTPVPAVAAPGTNGLAWVDEKPPGPDHE
jgi:hypothetical protein